MGIFGRRICRKEFLNNIHLYIYNVYIYNTVSYPIFTVCFNLLFVKGVLRTVYKVLLYSIKYNKYAENRMQTVCKPYTQGCGSTPVLAKF